MGKKLTSITHYSDWIKVFSSIKSGQSMDEFYDLMIIGKLKDIKYSKKFFEKELVVFIDFQLNTVIKDFASNLNKYLSIGDYDSLSVIILRFYNEVIKIKFYESLKFVDLKLSEQLSKSIDENIEELIKRIKLYALNFSEYNQHIFEIEYLINKYFTQGVM